MTLGFVVFPSTLAAQTQSVTFGWNPSTGTSVAGYMVYYGTNGTNLGSHTDAGTNDYVTVTALAQGTTYYFEVAAYDANNNIGPASSPVTYTTPTVTQTVTVLANPPNGGTVAGGGSFAAGSSVTVTATANGGYAFSNWTENGTVQSTSPTYQFTLAGNRNLTANFTANPATYTVAVQSNPTNAGSVAGGGAFVAGSSITVTATANSGHTFGNWTENGTVLGTSPSYAFTLTSNRNLVASFIATPVTYTVAVQGAPASGGNVSGGGIFVAGSSVMVTAIVSNGYTFGNWTANGIVLSTSPKYSFTLVTNCNLTANFLAVPVTYTVAAQSNPTNAGIVSGGGIYVSGSSVTVSETANSGYTFSNWTANGIVLSTSPKYNFALAADCSLVANFTKPGVVGNLNTNPVTYTVTSAAGQNGSISPSGPQSVGAGSNITFNATPSNQYQVSQWLVDGVLAQTGGSSFVLQDVTTNEGVTVTFSAVTNAAQPATNTNFTLVINGNGTVTPNLNATGFREGGKYSLTATAAKGSLFANWASNGVVVGTATRYTCIAASNFVLQANFVTNPFIHLAGSYRGLFYDTNGATEDTSGAFAATITSAGVFSARHTIAGRTYAYSGKFSLSGAVVKTIPRPGKSPVTVQLQLGATNSPMTGTIGDGTWTAQLAAVPVVYSRVNPAPLAGKYTLLVPGSTNAAAEPGGNGFGAVTVSKLGVVTFSGTLGDGTPVVSSSIVSIQGQWPLYVSLYNGKGSILGWLAFTNDGTISGQTGWFKLPQAAAKLYPGGFTNVAEVIGSGYQYTNGMPPLGFPEGSLSLFNGDLDQGITNKIALASTFQATGPGANGMIFRNASGLFRTSVTDPQTGNLIAVNGIVLQNQNIGAGYFLGANESGSAVLSPAQ